MQQKYLLRFVVARNSSPSRSCVHSEQAVRDDPGLKGRISNWVVLYVNDEHGKKKITKCGRCLHDALGFVPLAGRVKTRPHVCELCGRSESRCMMLGIDFVHKTICIPCFEGMGGM